jgi:ADP-heptose:LPS heptosyltransferase
VKKRILLLRLDAIGDFVLFTSILPHLRKIFQDDHLTLILHPAVAPLAEHCPYVDTIIEIDQKQYAVDENYAEEITKKVRGQFDVAINTMYTRTWQSDNIIARTHAPVKIGFQCMDIDSEQKRRMNEEILYTHLVHTTKEWMFELDRYKQFLDEIGVRVTEQNLKPELWISDKDKLWTKNFIQANLPTTKFTIMCPGAGFDTKLWSSQSFARVADYLIENKSMTVVIAGSEKDKTLASSIMAKTKNKIYDLTGKMSLNQFAALAEHSSLYLGIDTAGFHIVWTLGIPTIGIFGGGHFGRFTPSFPHVKIVHHKMDCYNCYWHCIYDETKCITYITPENVIAAIDQLLQNNNKVARG